MIVIFVIQFITMMMLFLIQYYTHIYVDNINDKIFYYSD